MNPTEAQKIELGAGDALVVLDLQKDFLPGGARAILGVDAIVPTLNRYLAAFASRHLPIFAKRDWHPANHCSFLEHGGRWPVHCVANSPGAEFPSTVIFPPWTTLISTGAAADQEGQSAFDGSDLERRLRGSGLRRLFIGGLATDYSVLSTVKDALARQFSVFLLRDAIRAANVKHDDGSSAEAEMLCLGAVPIRLTDLKP